MRAESVQDFLCNRAIQHVVQVLGRAADIGHRRDLGFRDDVVERPKANAVHIDAAELGLLDGVFLFAQLSRRENRDADAAIGALFNQLTHGLDGFNSRIAIAVGV